MFLLLLGVALVAITTYFEVANRSYGRLPAADLAKRVVGSRIPNLILYSAIVVTAMSVLGIILLERTQYSGMVFMTIFGTLVFLIQVFALNKDRFAPKIRGQKEIAQAYFEAIKNCDPEEGIDYIIRYTQDPRWQVPAGDWEAFLSQIALRQDEFGKAARNRIAKLGLIDKNSDAETSED